MMTPLYSILLPPVQHTPYKSGQQSRSLSSQIVNICECGAVLLLSLNLLFECFDWVRQTGYLYHPSIIVESATLPS